MGVHEDILQLEMKVRQLKTDYDQYFAGVLKIPPFKLHDEVKRMIRHHSGTPISNTALAFKYNSVVGRYTSYNSLWTRQMRDLDEGRITRGGRRTTPAGAEQKEIQESQAERIYKEYVAAKQKLNQKTDGIKVKAIADMLEKQTAQIKARFNCSTVDYKVVVEGGKAKIKAVPKK